MADKWKCPGCGATITKHGKGGGEACCNNDFPSDGCGGFVCECEDDGEDLGHGTAEDPCPDAMCYHCNWNGTFPVPTFDPKKLAGWAKQAHEAGWRPPTGWKPEKDK